MAGIHYIPMNYNWEALFFAVAKFSVEKFGEPNNPLPTLHHLKQEVDELIAEPGDATEYADGIILLLGAAYRAGLTMDELYDAVREKHRINSLREWGEPDANGVINHIEKS